MKISVKLALEAPPKSKTPAGNTDCTRQRRHPEGAAQDHHPRLSLFQQLQEGHVRRLGIT